MRFSFYRPAATPKRPDAGELQRWSPDIEPQHGSEEVDFDTFDPAYRHADGQDDDVFPNFPALKDFLAFWETKLEGPLFAVTVAHSKLIKPAELCTVDGAFRLH
jgi:uncharacterized protein Usg